jgi:[protein-PII] uridylyltransferase
MARAFQAAIDAGTEVTDEALSCIQQHVDHFEPDAFMPEGGTAARCCDSSSRVPACTRGCRRCTTAAARAAVSGVSGDLVACGSRLLPQYTVDEHTLLAIRNFERLANTDEPSRLRFKRIAEGIPSPELLVLSLLLHDVGKWRDDEHALESERMAVAVLDLLDVSGGIPGDRALPDSEPPAYVPGCLRRDTEDPEIVKEFAGVVGTEDRLKMLCLMTLADIEAVSPDTLTPWKEELIWRLYVDTYNHLTQRYADERIDRNQAGLVELLEGRPEDLPDWESRASSRACRSDTCSSSLVRPSTATYGSHAIFVPTKCTSRSNAPTRSGPSPWSRSTNRSLQQYLRRPVVVRHEHPARACAHQPNGLVLDVFQFTDDERFLALNPDAHAQVLHVLQEVVSGRLDVAELLRGRQQSVAQWRGNARVVPVVRADREASNHFTILDIVAGNALGLLYRISRVISRHGCDVDLVLISTEGERAIDVFHITKAGVKLTEAEQHALTSDLQGTLEGTL